MALDRRLNILIVLTGGTFGSNGGRKGLTAKEVFYADSLTKFASENLSTQFDFSFVNPFLKLSENIIPSDWEALGKAISETGSDSDGVLVLHGTDTMAYSAAASSFLPKEASNKPIIFTGSNFPVFMENSDAVVNFLQSLKALDYLVREKIQGSFIVFNGSKDLDSTGYIHFGTRVKKDKCMDFCYRSFYMENWDNCIGKITGLDSVHFDYDSYEKVYTNKSNFDFKVNYKFCPDKIYASKIYPGMTCGHFKAIIDSGIKSILLEVYNSGTGPTENNRFSLISVLEYAKKNNVNVFVVSQHEGGGGATMDVYESSYALKELGVISLQDMIWEAALPKLMLAHANLSRKDDICLFMLSNIAGEITPHEAVG